MWKVNGMEGKWETYTFPKNGKKIRKKNPKQLELFTLKNRKQKSCGESCERGKMLTLLDSLSSSSAAHDSVVTSWCSMSISRIFKALAALIEPAQFCATGATLSTRWVFDTSDFCFLSCLERSSTLVVYGAEKLFSIASHFQVKAAFHSPRWQSVREKGAKAQFSVGNCWSSDASVRSSSVEIFI